MKWGTFEGVCTYGATVWISPSDSQINIARALTRLRVNIPCSDPNCSHARVCTWSGATYHCHRPCAPAFQPLVCVDKHLPSLRAITAAGFRGAVLDGWHGYSAVSKHLADIVLVGGEAANVIMWAFRLWTRSQSHAHANSIRDVFVHFVIGHATSAQPLWTLEQAGEVTQYFLKHWHQPDIIRDAWIDGGIKKTLPADVGAAHTG